MQEGFISQELQDGLALEAWSGMAMYHAEQFAKATEWQMPIASTFELNFNASRMWLERRMSLAAPEALKAMRAVREPREPGSIPGGSAAQ
jgi:hypothetical protein